MRTVQKIPAVERRLSDSIRVGIYARVSSFRDSQEDSLENQINAYVKMVRYEPAWVLVDTYADQGSGRSISGRLEFQRMMQDCRDGKIEMIITKTVSRFGRNTLDTLDSINKLREMGVDVFFESEGLHTKNHEADVVLSMLAAYAQEQSENLSANIKWGLRHSLQSPNSKIYQRVCYGYKHGADGALEIDEIQESVVLMIFRLYLGGYSILGIQRELLLRGFLSPTGKDLWSKRTIDTMLSNEKYTGNVLAVKTYMAPYPENKRIANKGTRQQYLANSLHEPIIAQEDFDAVQEEKKRRSNVIINKDGSRSRKWTHYSMKDVPE